MLPRSARMSSSDDFRRTVRSGVRVGRPTVVVHATRSTEDPSVQVGFVVSKAIGNAVARNRVKRRLRHLTAERLDGVPAGTNLVVRALPDAAVTPHALASDLDRAWARAIDRVSS